VLELVKSISFVGNGTDADKLNVLIEFAKFIEINFRRDCFNTSVYANDFWYIWASNGQQGFLLDLIKAPDHLELRLDIYDATPGINPVVIRQFLDLSDFSISEDGMNVTMGPVVLTTSSCSGIVGNIPIDVRFMLSNRSNNFVPEWIFNSFPEVPDFQSFYGSVISAQVNGTDYQYNLPLVYSKYPINFGIDYWKWCLISIMSLTPSGSGQNDLQIEIAGTLIADIWVVTSFVYSEGKVYQFDDPFLGETKLTGEGQIVNGTTRIFSATIKNELGSVHLLIDCQAPVDKFAMLDKDGNTEIHTTLLGSCEVTDVKKGQTYNTNSALLEAKQKITNSTQYIDV